MTFEIHLNPEALKAVTESEDVRRVLGTAAEALAAAVSDQGLTAESGAEDSGPDIVGVPFVTTSGEDVPRGTVGIEHPAAIAMQARNGVLTRAAAAVGLEVQGGGE